MANRIHNLSKGSRWRFINSKLNLADDASWGQGIDPFLSSKRWLQGPEFLEKLETGWPGYCVELGSILPSTVEQGKRCKRGSSLFKLDPVIDADILRVGGWLCSQIKHHKSLPEYSRVKANTESHSQTGWSLLVCNSDAHIFYKLQQRYYVWCQLFGKKSEEKSSVFCKRQLAKPGEQKMADQIFHPSLMPA